MGPRESKDEREQRIARLWETLDSHKEGQIDLTGLRKGLKKLDHPLKNADSMLRSVLNVVDTSGDGRIQYDEFSAFVKHADKELWRLFQSIDRNNNGEIDKGELRDAFAKAGVTISNAKLDQFFEEVDANRDGVISYDEWRDFLLFLPAERPNLRIVLSYYSATGNLNPEGDVHINEPLQGLGIPLSFLTRFLLAVKGLFYDLSRVPVSRTSVASLGQMHPGPEPNLEPTSDIDLVFLDGDLELEWLPLPRIVAMWMSFRYYEQKLTENTPHLGYFLAGGIAGAVSRTATAPFDRLKVYLIARTDVKNEAALAAKEGSPLQAAARGISVLVDAMRDLWRAGGIRSLFAGNGLNVVKIMPESAIKFGAYEASKRAFARLEGHNDTKRLLPSSQFLSGGFGGMVAQCFVYPLDTLKFRMQCETVEGGLKGNQLIAATTKKMWQTNGILSFFRGLPLGVIGMFPYAAIDLTTFEYLKASILARKARLQHCHEDDVPLSNFTTGAIGAFSGAFGASVVYPLNVLRTRLQTQGTVLHPFTYDGIADVTRRTIRAEGFRGLYKGLTPTLLKVAPAVSISYVVYENAKRALALK
ncbi:Mitochondrial carrier domain containing protein [Elaphomyces granulatus]